MFNTMYNVHEAMGNFSEVVYRADSWYDVQEYLESRLYESDTDLDDESAVQLFYSYFNVETVTADYDYHESVKDDVIEYIKDNINLDDFDDVDELRDHLNDVLWAEDSVTGNVSGSYYCNAYKAEKALCGNLDLLAEAISELGDENDSFKYIQSAELSDVTIRCYILGGAIEDALEELGIEEEFELREENTEISVNAPELETA